MYPLLSVALTMLPDANPVVGRFPAVAMPKMFNAPGDGRASEDRFWATVAPVTEGVEVLAPASPPAATDGLLIDCANADGGSMTTAIATTASSSVERVITLRE